jgi:lysophospholipase L1-like esterase
MSPRLAGALVIAAFGLAACATAEANTTTGQPFEESPLPTIGLGSDLGSISGGAEVRAIDTGRVNSIVMIGDSITVGSTPYLEEQFAQLGFDDVSINAQTGKRIGVSFGNNASGADIAQFIAAAQESDPEETLWVVALGTNDIGQYTTTEEVAAEVDEILAPIPEEAPLIWVNTYFADRLESTAEVNAAIESRLSERGNATIGRWSELAPTDGVLRSDGIHPGDEGAKVFANLVTTTVANFLQ